jgi:hypothetical protein
MASALHKKHFAFQELATDIPEHNTARGAVALEFIAHYLDRIDGHLEPIANAAEKNAAASGKIADGIALAKK